VLLHVCFPLEINPPDGGFLNQNHVEECIVQNSVIKYCSSIRAVSWNYI
jgi:hypothetical protein